MFALLTLSIGSCAPHTQLASSTPLTVSSLPNQVPLRMAANTSPGFSGICYVRDGNLEFSFRKPTGSDAICRASCRFIDTANAVQFASTPPQGATAANKTEEFGLRGEGKNVVSALKPLDGEGACNPSYP